MTRVEVIFVVAVVVLLLGMVIPSPLIGCKAKATRIKCVSNLKNVGLAFRIFATDNNDRFPGAILASNSVDLASIAVLDIYLALTNELSTPKILYCPDDKKRKPAESFRDVSFKSISYFASIQAGEPFRQSFSADNPQSFLAGDRNMLVNGIPWQGLLALSTNVTVSWSHEMHDGQGNVVMGDGSVLQMSTARLKGSLHDLGAETNYIVFP